MTHADAATQELRAALEALLAGRRPEPCRYRFQPLRMGLLDIWQYDEQEFAFHDGRVILRGRNGSGKTKVLEVTSPFLFDANLTARRLDPFGTSARSMRDNLLYGDRKHQIGYVWCEYGRLLPDGTAEYRTLGAGMRAQATRSGPPDSWYFLTDKRVGCDFSLYSSGRQPRNDKELSEQLGSGAVFNTAESYRASVGRELFGLNPDRFRSLVELLITLRRPKLSENFGVGKLTEMLRDGLPPVDEAMVDELARGFDALARDQDELQDLVNTNAEVDRFLTQYRAYARKMVRHGAANVRSMVTKYDDVTREKRAAEDVLAESQTRAESLHQLAKELELGLAEQSARIRSLERRPEIEQQAVLLALEKQATDADRNAAEAAERLTDAQKEQESLERELRQAAGELHAAEEVLDNTRTTAAEHAGKCSLRLEHEVQAERLGTDPSSARTVLESVVDARRAAARHARQLVRTNDTAQSAFARAEAIRDDYAARRDAAREEVVRRQGVLTAEIEGVSTAVVSWSGDCAEGAWADDDVDRLLAAVHEAGQPGCAALADLVQEHFSAVESKLLALRAQIDSEHRHADSELAGRTAERARVAEEEDPTPPAPPVMRRDRTAENLAGAPLWRVLDFVDDLADDVRAHVETALLGAGLLDAWVTPDGTFLSPETLDVILVAHRTGSAEEQDLRAVLKPAQQCALPASTVNELLGSIAFLTTADPHREGPWISADGGWAIGPLRGRTRGTETSYIGAAAREQARWRRLQALDLEIEELSRTVRTLLQRRSDIEERLARVSSERRSCPSDQPVREARTLLDAAVRTASDFDAEVTRAEERLAARRNELNEASQALHRYTNEHSLPISSAALDELEIALADYRSWVRELVTRVERVLTARERVGAVRERTERQRRRCERTLEASSRAQSRAVELRSEYQSRYELIGADVERVLAELNEAKAQAEQIREKQQEVAESRHAAAEELGSARASLQAAENNRKQREAERAAAVATFEKLRKHGFLALTEVFGLDDRVDASLTRSVEDARRVEQALRSEDITEKARNNARNNIDDRFRDLQRQIEGADWRPWGDNDGDLFIVKVTHNGIDHSVPELQQIVKREIETRQGYLDEQERRLFAEVLLGRIGEHLRQRRVEANSLRDRMNELLRKQPTASGMRMQLIWEPDPDAGPDVKRAVALLDRQAAQFLSDEARDELVGFLAARVRKAREDDLVGDWKEHLHEALDYRKWSRFRLQVKHGEASSWADLNDATHQQGSGGEKAVMLQLPLFVAAAAHYEAAIPSAPRPVYLDEAFAGIDAEMRGSCMELLAQLDLDFVMASHDEWGFHAEVPGLVTYNLYRDPAVHGVLTTPFVWDGRTSRMMTDPALRNDEPALRNDESDEAEGGGLLAR